MQDLVIIGHFIVIASKARPDRSACRRENQDDHCEQDGTDKAGEKDRPAAGCVKNDLATPRLLGRIGLFRRGRRLGWTFAYHDKPQTFTIQSPRTGYRSRKCAGIAVPCSSAGTNPAIRSLSQMPQSRERSMKLATITMAGAAAV